MNSKIISRTLQHKTVSIWGIGYLGYTTIIQIQKHGFKCNVFDFFKQRLLDFKNDVYPYRINDETWSEYKTIPRIDKDSVKICFEAEKMFDDKSAIHIIAMPNENMDFFPNNIYSMLADLFKKFFSPDSQEILILFLSASYPNSISNLFLKPLEYIKNNFKCAAAFRTDWMLEEFYNSAKYIIGQSCDEGNDAKVFISNILQQNIISLDSIYEAEIFVNTKNSIEYCLDVFINQISNAYPDANIGKIAQSLTSEINRFALNINIGSGGYKLPSAVENIIKGAKRNHNLSLLYEIQKADINNILVYSDFILSRNIKNVLILGITTQSDKKEIALSPSVILAEILIKNNLNVYVHDSFFHGNELKEIISGSKEFDLVKNEMEIDVVFLMVAHREYKSFTQEIIDKSNIKSSKFIIDNTGIWDNIIFSENSIYYRVGSGKFFSEHK